jgi:ATP-dependent exoDNAse (exonuclease V) beta subunit
MGYLQAFLDITANYMSENSVDISSFLDWWEFSKEEFAVVVPETKPAVKIMSIHKAKGLEFPVVVIPYADWEHKTDKQLWLTSDPPLPTQPPLDIPMPVNSSKLLEETFFQGEYKEEKEKVLIDNINLLYVAFTRPVDALHIIAQRKKNNENYQLLNEQAVPMMEADAEREGRFTLGEPVSKETEKEKRLEMGYEKAERLISSKWYDRISIRRKATEFWRFDTGYRAERRNWGILVHHVLSHIRSLEDVPHAVDNALIAGDIGAQERITLERKINEIFEIDRVKEWFAPGQTVFAESPVITSEGVLRPDRVIISDDCVTLIDFKTGEKNKAHAGQVLKYRKTIEAMGYEHVEAYLFYLESKDIVGVK